MAVATRYLQSKGYTKNVLIVDLDVHQNGAKYTKNDKSILLLVCIVNPIILQKKTRVI